MGSSWWEIQIEAKILPERLLVQDILSLEGGRWEVVTPFEFEAFVSELERTKSKKEI